MYVCILTGCRCIEIKVRAGAKHVVPKHRPTQAVLGSSKWCYARGTHEVEQCRRCHEMLGFAVHAMDAVK